MQRYWAFNLSPNTVARPFNSINGISPYEPYFLIVSSQNALLGIMVWTVNKDVSVETEEDVIRSLAVVFAIQGGMGTDVNIVSENFYVIELQFSIYCLSSFNYRISCCLCVFFIF